MTMNQTADEQIAESMARKNRTTQHKGSTLILAFGWLGVLFSPAFQTWLWSSIDGVDDPSAPTFVEKYFRVLDTDQKLAESATCRVPQACISVAEKGVDVLLPGALISSGALAGCLSSGLTIRTFRAQDEKKKLHWMNNDLMLGFFPTHYSDQFPHFVLLAGALMDIAETVLGTRDSPGATKFSYQKVESQPWGGTELKTVQEPSLEVRSQVAPAVLVHEYSTAHLSQKKSRWISQFLQSLFKKSGNGVVLIAPQPREEIFCFRSVWLPESPVNSKRKISLTDHTLFNANEMVKRPRPDFCSRKPRVVFLNRNGSRFMADTTEVFTGIQEGLAGTFKHVDVEEIFFDNATFDEQVAVMQKTDILVAAHGAGVANALFMRADTYILEIMPFAYSFNGFQAGLKSVFETQGNFIYGEPDYEKFDKEAKRLCPDTCHECSRLLRKLRQKVDMTHIQERIQNFRNYPEFVALESKVCCVKALRAQNLQGDMSNVRRYLESWSAQRCPSA